MMNKVQVDMYAAGLHKEGSSAVKRYTKLELKDHFTLMCAAFDQPMYKVDKGLNVIDESDCKETVEKMGNIVHRK